MSVGNQASVATINSSLTALSVGLRNILQQSFELSQFINGQGTGLATLEGIGYSAADAQTALTMIGYLNTMAQIFNGFASQSPSFDFNNALSPLWAAQ